jgi:hypothetical protein
MKLQVFVLNALRLLKEEQETGREGNCSTNELIFLTGTGTSLSQRAVKLIRYRRLLRCPSAAETARVSYVPGFNHSIRVHQNSVTRHSETTLE